jgi:transposase
MAHQIYITIIYQLIAIILELKLALDAKDIAIKEERGTWLEACKMMDVQDAKIVELESKVEVFEKLIYRTPKKEVKKTSRNSNLSPSKDLNRTKRRNNRVKSGKKTGGQPGHPPHVLQMVDNPNKVIPAIPKVCEKCGKTLNDNKKNIFKSKQEVDIPPIEPIVRQYDTYRIQCDCGHISTGKFPARLKTKVQYGPNVRAMIAYASVYQLLPYKRLQEFFSLGFNTNFSQGTIFKSLKRTAKLLQPYYEEIRLFLEKSNWVGGDETSIVVNGKKHYNWVWQNAKATFIACEPTKSKIVISKYFPNGFPNAVYVCDRSSTQLSTHAMAYQICWIHLMRKLNFLEEAEDKDWAKKLKTFYARATLLQEQKKVWDRKEKEVLDLENDLNVFLLRKVDKELYPDTETLRKGLIDLSFALFTFLYYEGVPSHNNDSERAIRNSKVKMNISKQFKSAQQYFAIIRSCIDTFIKNDIPIFESLLAIEKGDSFSLDLDLR